MVSNKIELHGDVQEQLFTSALSKSYSEKFHKHQKKIYLLESLATSD